jgi:protein ImuB
MPRIACLRIPRFPIVVHQKQELLLKNKPFVLVPAKPRGFVDKVTYSNASTLSRISVFMCSPEASKKGIYAGMKLSDARATCANLLWRECNERLYEEAQADFVQTLLDCSPRVASHQSGIFILDASGRQRLGGENKLCRDILRIASKAGYVNGQVGIADSAFPALVATRVKDRRWFIVNHYSSAKFLATLPIDHLPLSQNLYDLLFSLGIKTMGQLVQIPRDDVLKRFGTEGLSAHELALGFDLSQPRIPVINKIFESQVDLGGPIEALNQTMFVMKSMLDGLTKSLNEEELRAEELSVSFFSDDEKFDERSIPLVQPSNNPKFLLDVVRLSLEAQPLTREFTGLKITIARVSSAQWQQSQISELPEIANDEKTETLENMNLLLQRFILRLGEDALVKPIANDQYLPEKAGRWQAVIDQQASTANHNYTDNSTSESNLVATVINTAYIDNLLGEKGLVPNLVLKKNTPPVPVIVEFHEGSPKAVRYDGRWHYIKRLTSPECLSGNWWDDPIRRSYYTALIDTKSEPLEKLEEPTLLSIFHEQDSKSWFVDGIYD